MFAIKQQALGCAKNLVGKPGSNQNADTWRDSVSDTVMQLTPCLRGKVTSSNASIGKEESCVSLVT